VTRSPCPKAAQPSAGSKRSGPRKPCGRRADADRALYVLGLSGRSLAAEQRPSGSTVCCSPRLLRTGLSGWGSTRTSVRKKKPSDHVPIWAELR